MRIQFQEFFLNSPLIEIFQFEKSCFQNQGDYSHFQKIKKMIILFFKFEDYLVKKPGQKSVFDLSRMTVFYEKFHSIIVRKKTYKHTIEARLHLSIFRFIESFDKNKCFILYN